MDNIEARYPGGKRYALMQTFFLLGIIFLSPAIEGGPSYFLLTILRLALLLMIATWMWGGLKDSRFVLKKTGLDLPIAIFVLLALASSLFISPYKYVSMQWMSNIFGYAVLFYAAVFIGDSEDRRKKIIWAVVGMGLIEALAAWGQHFFLGLSRVAGTYSNTNFLAGYLAAASSLVVGLILFGRDLTKRLVLIGALFIMLAAMLFTGSRGGLLSFGVALFFMLWLKFKRWAIYLMVGLVILFIVIPNPAYQRIKTLPQTDIYAYSRLEMWNGALSMMKDNPTGIGLGMYEYVSRRYAFPNPAAIAHYGKGQENAHNEYLQIGVELGVAGFFVLLYGLFRLVRNIREAWRYEISAMETGEVAGLAGGVVAILTHSLVDFNLHSPGIACLLVIFAGLLATMKCPEGGEQKIVVSLVPARYHYGAVVLIAALTSILLSKSAAAYYLSVQGDELRKKGDIAGAIGAYESAINLDGWATRYYEMLSTAHFAQYIKVGDPAHADAALKKLDYAEYLNRLNARLPQGRGKIYAHLAERTQDGQVRRSLLQAALECHQKSMQIDPFNPLNIYETGAVLLSMERYKEAVEVFAHLKDLEPNFIGARIALARCYKKMGRSDAAREEYAAALSVKKQFRSTRPSSQMEAIFLGVDEDDMKREMASFQ